MFFCCFFLSFSVGASLQRITTIITSITSSLPRIPHRQPSPHHHHHHPSPLLHHTTTIHIHVIPFTTTHHHLCHHHQCLITTHSLRHLSHYAVTLHHHFRILLFHMSSPLSLISNHHRNITITILRHIDFTVTLSNEK